MLPRFIHLILNFGTNVFGNSSTPVIGQTEYDLGTEQQRIHPCAARPCISHRNIFVKIIVFALKCQLAREMLARFIHLILNFGTNVFGNSSTPVVGQTEYDLGTEQQSNRKVLRSVACFDKYGFYFIFLHVLLSLHAYGFIVSIFSSSACICEKAMILVML